MELVSWFTLGSGWVLNASILQDLWFSLHSPFCIKNKTHVGWGSVLSDIIWNCTLSWCYSAEAHTVLLMMSPVHLKSKYHQLCKSRKKISTSKHLFLAFQRTAVPSDRWEPLTKQHNVNF